MVSINRLFGLESCKVAAPTRHNSVTFLCSGEGCASDIEFEVIRRLILYARATGNERLYSHALMWLNKTRGSNANDTMELVLGASVIQRTHHFSEANELLTEVLKQKPDNIQAWLVKYSISLVHTNYPEARFAAINLLNKAPLVLATAAIAEIGSLTGKAHEAYRALIQSLGREQVMGQNEKAYAWAHTICAEIAARLGMPREAEMHFNLAMQMGIPDAYLVYAYADFLLDYHRYVEAKELLECREPTAGTLVRLALVKKDRGSERILPSELHSIEQKLLGHMHDEKFIGHHYRPIDEKEGCEPGATLPLPPGRLAARFLLELEGSAEEALDLAVSNWKVQRLPRDAEILLKCAYATGDIQAAAPVLGWMEHWEVQDVRLEALRDKLDNIRPQF